MARSRAPGFLQFLPRAGGGSGDWAPTTHVGDLDSAPDPQGWLEDWGTGAPMGARSSVRVYLRFPMAASWRGCWGCCSVGVCKVTQLCALRAHDLVFPVFYQDLTERPVCAPGRPGWALWLRVCSHAGAALPVQTLWRLPGQTHVPSPCQQPSAGPAAGVAGVSGVCLPAR